MVKEIINAQLKILVVDDDEGIRVGCAMLLKKYDYQVAVASNGILALQAFVCNPCDLVVTDIHMPEGDGLTLIKELKALDRDIKIIAISGGATIHMDPHESALNLGADIALTKPISASNLIEVVQNLLE